MTKTFPLNFNCDGIIFNDMGSGNLKVIKKVSAVLQLTNIPMHMQFHCTHFL